MTLFLHGQRKCTGGYHADCNHIDKDQNDNDRERPFEHRHDQEQEGCTYGDDDPDSKQIPLMDDAAKAANDEAPRNNGDSIDSEQHAKYLRRHTVNSLVYKRRPRNVSKASSVNEAYRQRISDKGSIFEQASHRTYGMGKGAWRSSLPRQGFLQPNSDDQYDDCTEQA